MFNRLKKLWICKRKPAHPGRIIRNLYLKPLSLTITELAESICVPEKRFQPLSMNGMITPEMALRLSQAFGTTLIWLNQEKKHDLWCAMNANKD
ncbi:MAG: HigA family addiction module antitoxin [Desulfobacterales bacterium]